MADNYDDKIKKAKLYQDALDATNKRIKSQEDAIKGLSEITGIAFAGFIQQVEKTNAQRREEVKLINDAKKAVKAQTNEIGNLIDKTYGITDALKSNINQSDLFQKSLRNIDPSNIAGSLENIEDVQSRMNELIKEYGEENLEQNKEFKELKSLKEEYRKNEEEAMKVSKDDVQELLDNNTELAAILGEMPINLNDAAEVQRTLNGLISGEKDMVDAVITSESANVKIKEQLTELDDNRIESQGQLNRLQEEHSNQMTIETNVLKNIGGLIKKKC